MKKTIIIIIAFILCSLGYGYAYIENLVFCTITENSITITIKKEDNYQCSEYLKVLSQSINTEYNDIVSAQNLINKWYDISFWEEIRDSKIENLKKLISLKEQIENAIKEFDNNLFLKIKDYIIYTISPDRADYQLILKTVKIYQKKWQKLSSKDNKKIQQVQECIDIIDSMMTTNDFETLIKNFNKYLYLKNQITWK